MVSQTLFVLCIFTAGLMVQSVPTPALMPVSLLEKTISPTDFWISSPQSPSDTPASDTPSNSVFPVTVPSKQTSPLPKNASEEPIEQETTGTWEGTNTDPLSTSDGVYVTPTLMEYSWGTPEASVPPTGSQSPDESPALTSPQAPATFPPEVSSVSDSTESSTETSTDTSHAGTSATPEPPAQEHSSSHIPTSPTTSELVPVETTPQRTVPAKVTCILVDTKTSPAPRRVVVQEEEHALNSGTIAVITVGTIAAALFVFAVAAYLRVRHSTYGRLLDDHDYGSWGNYNNPLYDDS